MMKKIHFVCLLFWALLPSLAAAQVPKTVVLDSLQKSYQQANHDTVRVMLLSLIAPEYLRTKPDTTFALLQKAIQTSEHIGYKRGQLAATLQLANAFRFKNNPDQALSLYQKAVQLAEIVKDKISIGGAWSNIGRIYNQKGNYELALQHYQKSIDIAEKTGDTRLLANGLILMGNIYYSQGNYPLSLMYFQKALQYFEDLKDKAGIANCLNNIGNIHYSQGNLSLVLEYYQKALVLYESLRQKQKMAYMLSNMGAIYEKQNKLPQALDNYQRALQLSEELNDKKGIAGVLTNMGTIAERQNNWQQSFGYYEKAFGIYQEIGDRLNGIHALNGMATICQKQGQHIQAFQYAHKGLETATALGVLPEISMMSGTLYEFYKAKKDYVKALEYHERYKATNDSIFDTDKSKQIASLEAKAELDRKSKEIELLQKNQELLAKDNELQRIENERQKNARLAIEKQAEADRLLHLARTEQDRRKQDSLLNLSRQTQLLADNLKAKELRLEAENRAKQSEIVRQQEAQRLQQIINVSISVFLLLTLVLLYVIWLNRKNIKAAYYQIKEANRSITRQKEEIQQQAEELNATNQALHVAYQEISLKNDSIIASINYAQRIQAAIIPSESELQKHFEAFVFFRPRDIVSGDFYWFADKGEAKILAVADCTGHGVSGAFMTMIGNNLLNQIVHDQTILSPAQILGQMQIQIEKTLSQSDTRIADGMDIAILAFEQDGSLRYAGAMNPFYIVQEGQLTEIKADKVPVGGQRKADFEYREHALAPAAGAMIYLCSDGYQDQFGGAQDKKFMVGKLKKHFVEWAQLPVSSQKQAIAQTFDQWKGAQPQTDDVLVTGIRVRV